MTGPSLMHETGHSKPVHWDNPEGWGGEGGGRGFQDGPGVSREVPCSALKGETVPDSLPATPKSPPMHETGHSKPVHWDNPEGWDGEGDGRGVQDGGEELMLLNCGVGEDS